MRLVAVTPALLASACSFDPLPPLVTDADPSDPDADSTTIDALGACEPNSIQCDDDARRYTECSPEGMVAFMMACPLGCAPDEEKCLDIDPSNGLAEQLDLAADGPTVEFAGTSLFDRDGNIFNGGTTIQVPSAVVNGIRVYRFKSLRVSGTLDFENTYFALLPVAFVVDGDVEIDGLVDISGEGAWGTAGGSSTGFDGEGHCGAASFDGISPTPGGGGGGHAGFGGQGGSTTAATGIAGSGAMNNTELVPLLGGCSGSTINEGALSNLAAGGGGGGGLQIVSRTRIRVTGAGAIDASGAGGSSAPTTASGGGGGGSGGAILLEAPQILLDGGVLSTKGGGGAAACVGAGCDGTDGGVTAAAAPGGTHATLPRGGAGGTRTGVPGEGDDGASSGQDGGGGGGAVGRIRFNTEAGDINPQGDAAIYSQYTTGQLRSRLAPP